MIREEKILDINEVIGLLILERIFSDAERQMRLCVLIEQMERHLENGINQISLTLEIG